MPYLPTVLVKRCYDNCRRDLAVQNITPAIYSMERGARFVDDVRRAFEDWTARSGTSYGGMISFRPNGAQMILEAGLEDWTYYDLDITIAAIIVYHLDLSPSGGVKVVYTS